MRRSCAKNSCQEWVQHCLWHTGWLGRRRPMPPAATCLQPKIFGQEMIRQPIPQPIKEQPKKKPHSKILEVRRTVEHEVVNMNDDWACILWVTVSVDFKQQSKLTDFLVKVSFWSFLRRNETKMVKMFNFHRFFLSWNFTTKLSQIKATWTSVSGSFFVQTSRRSPEI